MKKNYYIGGGGYYDNNNQNKLFNKVYVPRLWELGIKEKDMDEVAKMFKEIYDIGYSNGANNEYRSLNDLIKII